MASGGKGGLMLSDILPLTNRNIPYLIIFDRILTIIAAEDRRSTSSDIIPSLITESFSGDEMCPYS